MEHVSNTIQSIMSLSFCQVILLALKKSNSDYLSSGNTVITGLFLPAVLMIFLINYISLDFWPGRWNSQKWNRSSVWVSLYISSWATDNWCCSPHGESFFPFIHVHEKFGYNQQNNNWGTALKVICDVPLTSKG